MLKQAILQPLDCPRENDKDSPCVERRGFLKLAAVSLGTLVTSPLLAKTATTKERTISFHNARTNESLKTVYWTPREGYIRDSLHEISRILRDHRTGQIKIFDPALIDQMYILKLKMDYRKPLHIVSGYRSPATNAMLRRRNRAVAKNSFHMYGKAVDIRLPGHNIGTLYRAAVSLKAGGVGYYPRSNFIHIDTGPIRTWR